uniref:Probable cytochrome P450 6a14 n=1 Tax=Cacopsylla melanoneura TaxID=428564 RepID=A0A8D8X8G7_9HEMI
MAILTSSLILDTIILCSLPLIVLFIKSKLIYRYWKNKQVVFFNPSFPFGDFSDLLLFRKTFHQFNTDFYNKIKYDHKKPFGGLYSINKPVLMVTDPEFLKNILIKDFDYFTDRGLFEGSESNDPLAGHLFNKKGNDWRRLRNKLSPTFTSGKIKYMTPLIVKCSDNLVNAISKQFGDSNQINLELKDYCARYTTDVIGSTAFGIEINCLENPDSEFRQISQLLLTPSVFITLKTLVIALVPVFKPYISILDSRVASFFTRVFKSNVVYREKNHVERNDFLNLLMQLRNAQKGKEIGEDDVEITPTCMVAQSFVFFVAGFETSSSALSFCLYEMAKNQQLQSKLRQEILDTQKQVGELNYEALQSMSLLDKITKETLRKYPSVPQLDRVAVKEYKIPDTDITLDVGTKISIPSFAIHYDPEYYPNPDQFDPERFTPENIEARPHYTYLPFGDGPRNCIGMRFGLIQFKSGLAHLMANFQFSIEPENLHFDYLTGSFLLQTVKPLVLNVKRVFQ